MKLITLKKKALKLLQICMQKELFFALLKGVAASVEHEKLLSTLSCTCVVDIGANRGQFALIARKVFPDARIYSFEPLGEPAKTFQKVFVNDKNTHLYPFAIGETETISAIHITQDDDSSSLFPPQAAVTNLFPGSKEIKTRQIKVFPLSQILKKSAIPEGSLLKIDVQGYELEVLKGCEDVLPQFLFLYIECSFIELYLKQPLAHDVITWLKKRGFVMDGIYNTVYDHHGLAIQADFLFAKESA